MKGPDARVDRILGDRRKERRYPLELPLYWRLVYRRRLVDSGTARTRDLSSHGILFETDKMFAEGSELEVSVAWPALLGGAAPLKLQADGLVVRSDGKLTAIRMMRYEFRTVAAPAQRQTRHGGGDPAPTSWSLSGAAGVTRLQ